MKKINLMIIGGFLGAGKTTSILKIAKHLTARGKKVGIVTNDQGSQLVDTNFIAKSGLPVLEVTGGCFCCNFEEFIHKINELSEAFMPDIILAEPVGSCTDLIATVFKPIMTGLTKNFTLSPLSIVVDPKRVKKLMIEDSSVFSSEINYLFEKQLEEADVIVLNKIDTVSDEQAENIVSFLKEKFKGIDILTVSAKEGYGIEDWVSLILSRTALKKPSLNINYDTYAFAEESLGWFDGTFLIDSALPHNANNFIIEVMQKIKIQIKNLNSEIAHLKVYEISGQDYAKASLTSISAEVDFNRKMNDLVRNASFIINARINTPPNILKNIVIDALNDAASLNNINLHLIDLQWFKPGKPQPKYRL